MIFTPCVTCESEIDRHSGEYVVVVKRGLRFIVLIGEDQKV